MDFAAEWRSVNKVAGRGPDAQVRAREALSQWLGERGIDLNQVDEADIRMDDVMTPQGEGIRLSVRHVVLGEGESG